MAVTFCYHPQPPYEPQLRVPHPTNQFDIQVSRSALPHRVLAIERASTNILQAFWGIKILWYDYIHCSICPAIYANIGILTVIFNFVHYASAPLISSRRRTFTVDARAGCPHLHHALFPLPLHSVRRGQFAFTHNAQRFLGVFPLVLGVAICGVDDDGPKLRISWWVCV
jgi:hypothetical protein